MSDCGTPDSGFVAERLASYLDCHAQSLAQNGFNHLAGGWIGSAFLGSCLTIYVALIGYRLILGVPYGPRDVLLAAARAGTVMAIATSWPAYETIVYRLVFDGPAEAAGALLPADLAPLPITDAAERLDQDLIALRKMTPVSAAAAAPAAGGAAAAPQPSQSQTAQARDPGRDPILDGTGPLLAEVTVGTLGAIRIVGGLLLGVGPLFVVLALFDVALGIFEGWVRALMVVFVAALGGMVVTALELGFIENGLISGNPIGADPGLQLEPTLVAIGAFFALAMSAVMIAAFVVGGAFRLPRASKATAPPPRAPAPIVQEATSHRLALAPPSRADAVVEAVRRLSARETTQSTSMRASMGSLHRSHDRGLQTRSVGVQAAREPGRQTPVRRWSPSRASSLQRGDQRP